MDIHFLLLFGLWILINLSKQKNNGSFSSHPTRRGAPNNKVKDVFWMELGSILNPPSLSGFVCPAIFNLRGEVKLA
jgi:hypothetical protein